MVIENLSDVSVENLSNQISHLTTFIQAIGGVIFLYLVFNLANVFINRKKQKGIKEINKNLEEIKSLLRKNNKK